jgi:hypothetical protein
MITGGKYSVWFRTPIGEGAGVVDFQPNGKLSGGHNVRLRRALDAGRRALQGSAVRQADCARAARCVRNGRNRHNPGRSLR